MKTKLHFIFFMIIGMMTMQAQNRTIVTANSVDISDNLDLRAIATIFGESATLEDFERRLNDPEIQISNLDLNNDNQVDYLRIIESVENRTHLVIIQSVIGRDVFQDVATIEIERMQNNQLQVQVVGNTFLYGTNYIYEPVFHYSPVIYNTFWVHSYRPYFSPWHWNYYPSFYYAWNPFPYFNYQNHINFFVNYNNTCHYVNHRRSNHAVAMHRQYRTNGYERLHPTRSFQNRNNGFQNRHDLVGNASGSREQMASSTPRPSRANSYSVLASTGTRSSATNSSISPRPTRANSHSTTASNRTRSLVSNSYSAMASAGTRSTVSNYAISPRPTRVESPKSSLTATETYTNTSSPSQRNTKSDYIANNNPRETRSNQSISAISAPKPSINSVRNSESSSYSSTRPNTRATQSQSETRTSNSSQPRMNQSSSNRTEQSKSEKSIQPSSSQRTSVSTMRRG